MELDRTSIETFLKKINKTPRYQELVDIKSWSMLHWEVLAIMEYFASNSEGPIVEFGPYLGASTTVLASAAPNEYLPILTVEMGGAHNHPTLPTKDILSDLKDNLTRQGVRERVKLLEGISRDPVIVEKIAKYLDGRKIGLLVIDTDGNVEEDLKVFASMCAPACLIIIDDYSSTGAPEKASLTKPVVDRLRGEGQLTEFGVYGWGTWVGQISGTELKI
jgi:predicted O-methyltransferase YrrM